MFACIPSPLELRQLPECVAHDCRALCQVMAIANIQCVPKRQKLEHSDNSDYLFVHPPPDYFRTECSICLLFIRSPHLTSCCGHNFCKECIESSLVPRLTHAWDGATSVYARPTRRVLLTYLSYSAEDGGFSTTYQVQLLAKTFSQARSWLTTPTISISYSPKLITYITQVLTSLPDV